MNRYNSRNTCPAGELLGEKFKLMGELGCIRKLREELQEADDAAAAYEAMLCSPTGHKKRGLMSRLFRNLAQELADVDISGRRTFECSDSRTKSEFARHFKSKTDYVLNTKIPRILGYLRKQNKDNQR